MQVAGNIIFMLGEYLDSDCNISTYGYSWAVWEFERKKKEKKKKENKGRKQEKRESHWRRRSNQSKK